MADLEDVEDALKAIIVGAIYPTGTDDPSAILLGDTPVPCAVMRGWPMKAQLEADHAAGVQIISIFIPPQSMRNTSRHPPGWVDLTTPTPTLTITPNEVTGTLTIAGFVQTPQNVAAFVNGRPYVYAVQEEDSLADIATGLAALINVDFPASHAGAVVTVTGAYRLTGRVGMEGTVQRVIRQQEQMVDVGIWCSTPELRKAVAEFVDGALAGKGLANPRNFLAMPDTSLGRLIYRGTRMFDTAQQQGVFRRDLVYTVDYATTETVAATPVLVGDPDISI